MNIPNSTGLYYPKLAMQDLRDQDVKSRSGAAPDKVDPSEIKDLLDALDRIINVMHSGIDDDPNIIKDDFDEALSLFKREGGVISEQTQKKIDIVDTKLQALIDSGKSVSPDDQDLFDDITRVKGGILDDNPLPLSARVQGDQRVAQFLLNKGNRAI